MQNRDKIVLDKVIEYLKDNRNAHNSELRNDAHRLLDWIDRWVEEVNINE